MIGAYSWRQVEEIRGTRIAQEVDGKEQPRLQVAQQQLTWVIAEWAKLPRVKTAEDLDTSENIVKRVGGALQRANNRARAWEWRAKTEL